MLKFYTAQFRYSDTDRFDITVKSGNQAFAPSWGLVSDYKSGQLTQEEYTKRYLNLMRKSYEQNRTEWDELLAKKDEVTLVCFCAAGYFCHRYILADILQKLGATYMGEREIPKKSKGAH